MSRKLLILPFLSIFTLIVGSTAYGTYARSRSETLANVGTAFTYQGVLSDGDSPASGIYDFQFALFDALAGGIQVGSTITKDDINIANGLLLVELDFGNVYDGTLLYLEIRMRDGASTGSYTTLSPRQTLTPAPYAIHAASANSAPWSGLTGVPAEISDGDDDSLADLQCTNGQVAKWNGSVWSCANDIDTDTDTLATLTCSTGLVAKWNGTAWSCATDNDTNTDTLATLVCSNGQVAKWNGSAWACANDTDTNTTYSNGTGLNLVGTVFSLNTSYTDGRYWSLTGNSGTVDGTNFLGTTDNVPLTMKVNNTEVLILEPDATASSVMMPVNAGDSKSVQFGERYRDNAIVAWARVQSGGTLYQQASFGISSVSHLGTGQYEITIDQAAIEGAYLIPIAIAEIDTAPVISDTLRIVSINQVGATASAVFEVYINKVTGALVDNDFVFMVTGR